MLTKEQVRNRNYRHRYGLTSAQVDAQIQAQRGCCAICGRSTKLNVDHDHRTFHFRGMLCLSCNVALGHMLDEPIFLWRALNYLKER